MAVNLPPPADLRPVPGVQLGTANAGIKSPGREDLVLLRFSAGTRVSAVFTRNVFCAAPVQLAKQHLERGQPAALLINSGNANAGTGREGLDGARACCETVAQHFSCEAAEVLPFSTGVIGEQLPVERMIRALEDAAADMSGAGWLPAARAIMTTDTVAKAISRSLSLDGKEITITGMAKGSGMIRPDMATMLAFVATDANVEPAALDACLRAAMDESFHCISVDGDTSTNDACVLAATGRAGNTPLGVTGAGYETFRAAVKEVCVWLAQAIVRDGEGATHFITVSVEGAGNASEARTVAFTVAQSPLVKTACYANDPNWGRILAAVGRAPVESLDLSAVDIALDELGIVRGGEPDPAYSEARGAAVMARPEYTIGIRLGRGAAGARVYTCDLSHEYVRINAEYRT